MYGGFVMLAYVCSRAVLGSPVSRVLSRTTRYLDLPAKSWINLLGDIFIFVFPVVYFGLAGRVPAYEMLVSTDYYVSSGLRHDFHDGIPTVMSYAGEYYIKAVAPLWLLYSSINRRPVFWPLAVYLGLVALAMITKSVVVIIFLPTLVYQLFSKKWAPAAVSALIVVGTVYGNILLQDKSLSAPRTFQTNAQGERIGTAAQGERIGTTAQGETIYPTNERGASLLERVLGLSRGIYVASDAILTRLFYVHGLTVKFWMDSYTTDFPIENGCGYRWYASLAGCQFVYIPEKISLKYFPDLHARGVGGSVSSANYVNAFANFGVWGVIIAGLLTGLLLGLLTVAFPNPVIAIAVNATSIALTFENTLSILLNSGGWALFVVLAVLFLPTTPPLASKATVRPS